MPQLIKAVCFAVDRTLQTIGYEPWDFVVKQNGRLPEGPVEVLGRRYRGGTGARVRDNFHQGD